MKATVTRKGRLAKKKVLGSAIGQAMVLAAWDQVAHAQTTNFTYTGGFQTWTVLTTGLYDITAFGGQGGSGFVSGGLGAKVEGDFSLTAGQVLSIAVGGAGTSIIAEDFGGGGGGSFVTLSGTALAIAGGGGGGGSSTGRGGPGLVGGTGGTGDSSSHIGTGGTGGASGSGGGGGFYGGGGGGFLGNGTSGAGASGGRGGFGFPAGLAGGYSGGFGGGGGGARAGGSYGSGGGGGGYSGGGGGGYDGNGGGGGSFNAGINQINVSGFESGNGMVEISQVPEPTSFSLVGLGLVTGAAGFGIRRRRSRSADVGSRRDAPTQSRELC